MHDLNLERLREIRANIPISQQRFPDVYWNYWPIFLSMKTSWRHEAFISYFKKGLHGYFQFLSRSTPGRSFQSVDTYFNQTGALVLIDRHLQLILLVIRTGPRTIIIYVILISNKAKTLRLQLMRTYVWNLTDLIDDIRLESLTAKLGIILPICM